MTTGKTFLHATTLRATTLRATTWSVLAISTVLACKRPAEREADDKDAKVADEEPASKAGTDDRAKAEQAKPQDTAGDSALVAAAREVAAAMQAAGSALDANDVDKAKTELSNAISALARLEANRPGVGVAVELWRRHQQLEDDQLAGAVDTLPLLVTATRVDVPVYDRDDIQAHHDRRKSQSPESISKQDKRSDLRLIDSNLVYYEVDIPIAASEIALVEARQLVDQGKPDEASAALQHGIESVSVVEVIAEAPELRGRQQIWAAKEAFSRGRLDEANELLGRAHELLAPLVERGDDPQEKLMVTTLLDHLGQLRGALAAGSGGEQQADALQRISRRALNLARREALRAKLRNHQTQDQYAVVDALTWLENARIDSALQPSPELTRALELARAALDQAIEAAHSSIKPTIEELRARVGRIAELDTATPRDHDVIESDLDDAILDLRMLTLDSRAPSMSHGQNK